MRKTDWLLMLLVIGILVPAMMAGNLAPRLPDRDSGVFLYAGQRILQGDVPYRDFWDHKGPAIFYINALGLLIGQGSEVGVWVLEAFAVGLAGILGYVVMRREFGSGSALLASAAWLAAVGYAIRPGNYTEEFGLPLQFGALLLFSQSEARKAPRISLVGVGASLAALVLLRPNNAALPLSILAFLVLDAIAPGRRARRLADVATLLVGFAIVMGGVLAYFAAEGALAEMWDAVVVYNATYMRADLFARVDAITEGLRLLAPSGLGVLGSIGWIGCVVRWIWGGGRRARSTIEQIAVIALVAEFAMVAAAGRSLNHYFATWLPTLALLAASTVRDLLQPLGDLGTTPWASRLAWLGILVAMCLVPVRDLMGQVKQLRAVGQRDAKPIAQEITAIGGDTETLLMWGAESAFNFLLGVRAPTRYVYQYPLYMCGYTTPAKVGELAADIRKTRPLIVDTSSSNALVPPIDASEREAWEYRAEGCSLTEAMEDLLVDLDRSYAPVGAMPSTGWTVYRYQGDGLIP